MAKILQQESFDGREFVILIDKIETEKLRFYFDRMCKILIDDATLPDSYPDIKPSERDVSVNLYKCRELNKFLVSIGVFDGTGRLLTDLIVSTEKHVYHKGNVVPIRFYIDDPRGLLFEVTHWML